MGAGCASRADKVINTESKKKPSVIISSPVCKYIFKNFHILIILLRFLGLKNSQTCNKRNNLFPLKPLNHPRLQLRMS